MIYYLAKTTFLNVLLLTRTLANVGSHEGALALMTSTTSTTPQVENVIGRVRKTKHASRAARTLENLRAVLCKTIAI